MATLTSKKCEKHSKVAVVSHSRKTRQSEPKTRSSLQLSEPPNQGVSDTLSVKPVELKTLSNIHPRNEIKTLLSTSSSKVVPSPFVQSSCAPTTSAVSDLDNDSPIFLLPALPDTPPIVAVVESSSSSSPALLLTENDSELNTIPVRPSPELMDGPPFYSSLYSVAKQSQSDATADEASAISTESQASFQQAHENAAVFGYVRPLQLKKSPLFQPSPPALTPQKASSNASFMTTECLSSDSIIIADVDTIIKLLKNTKLSEKLLSELVSGLTRMISENPVTLRLVLKKLSVGIRSAFHLGQPNAFVRHCKWFAKHAPSIIQFGIQNNIIQPKTLARNVDDMSVFYQLFRSNRSELFSMIENGVIPPSWLMIEDEQNASVMHVIVSQEFGKLCEWIDKKILSPRDLNSILLDIADQRPEFIDKWILDPTIDFKVRDLLSISKRVRFTAGGTPVRDTVFERMFSSEYRMDYLRNWIEKGLTTLNEISSYSCSSDGRSMVYIVAVYDPNIIDDCVQSKKHDFSIYDLERVESSSHTLNLLCDRNPSIIDRWLAKGLINRGDINQYEYHSSEVRARRRLNIK